MLILTDTDANLRVIDWSDHEPRMRLLLERQYRKQGLILEESTRPNAATRALESYFAGDLSAIDNLPTKTGGTLPAKSLDCTPPHPLRRNDLVQ